MTPIKCKFQIKKKPSKNIQKINGKCTQLLMRCNVICLITSIFIGYAFFLARNSNLMGTIQYFDVQIVTNSSKTGEFILLYFYNVRKGYSLKKFLG